MDTHQIWQQFHDELRSFIRSRVRHDADADEILQKVFLNIHRSLSNSGPPNKLRGWVYQIARNAITDSLRSRKAGASSGSAAHDMRTVPDDEPDSALAAERSLAACLRPLLQTLPPLYSEALIWTELDGLSQQEAASRAGLSLSGMKSRIQRGRQSLREAMRACCQVEFDQANRAVDYQVNPSAPCQANDALPGIVSTGQCKPCCSTDE